MTLTTQTLDPGDTAGGPHGVGRGTTTRAWHSASRLAAPDRDGDSLASLLAHRRFGGHASRADKRAPRHAPGHLDSAAPRQSMFQAGPIAEPVHPYIFASVTKALRCCSASSPPRLSPTSPATVQVIDPARRVETSARWRQAGRGSGTAILAQARSSASTFRPEISLMTRDREWCTSVTPSR